MSRNNNFFDGDSYYAIFARLTYKWFISREWVTYADIMADYMMLGSAKELETSVSKCDGYGELKKSVGDVKRAIVNKLGNECFEERGSNRNKSFRYIGVDEDPLADIRNAKVVKDLKQYWQFCQDSAGFFPTSWLEFFFQGSKDLLDIKRKRQHGEHVLSASLDRTLTNIELLPILYQAIKEKKVLSIRYQPFHTGVRELIFHPHYLKEYNERWHLYGTAEGCFPELGFDIALDRIVEEPVKIEEIEYKSAPKGFYSNYFKDIVGVSHKNGTQLKEIRIRAHSLYIFKLMETKILHHSQKTIVPFGKYKDGTYGDFSVKVKLNKEFIGRILQKGAGLEIISPMDIREEFKRNIEDLAQLYEK